MYSRSLVFPISMRKQGSSHSSDLYQESDLGHKPIHDHSDRGSEWTNLEEKVAALPPNVQSIIAAGGLERWVKNQIEAS